MGPPQDHAPKFKYEYIITVFYEFMYVLPDREAPMKEVVTVPKDDRSKLLSNGVSIEARYPC